MGLPPGPAGTRGWGRGLPRGGGAEGRPHPRQLGVSELAREGLHLAPAVGVADRDQKAAPPPHPDGAQEVV